MDFLASPAPPSFISDARYIRATMSCKAGDLIPTGIYSMIQTSTMYFQANCHCFFLLFLSFPYPSHGRLPLPPDFLSSDVKYGITRDMPDCLVAEDAMPQIYGRIVFYKQRFDYTRESDANHSRSFQFCNAEQG